MEKRRGFQVITAIWLVLENTCLRRLRGKASVSWKMWNVFGKRKIFNFGNGEKQIARKAHEECVKTAARTIEKQNRVANVGTSVRKVNLGQTECGVEEIVKENAQHVERLK